MKKDKINWKCKLGFHKPIIIGEAPYPYDLEYKIVAYGCGRCGKQLKRTGLVKL